MMAGDAMSFRLLHRHPIGLRGQREGRGPLNAMSLREVGGMGRGDLAPIRCLWWNGRLIPNTALRVGSHLLASWPIAAAAATGLRRTTNPVFSL